MFEYRFHVRGYELDSNGHANHAVYLNYFEQARWELLRQTRLLGFLKESGLAAVVIEVNVRYSREVNMFDELVILTEGSPEPPYLVFKQKMYFMDTNVKACAATVKVIFTGEGKLVRDIPKEILEKLG